VAAELSAYVVDIDVYHGRAGGSQPGFLLAHSLRRRGHGHASRILERPRRAGDRRPTTPTGLCSYFRRGRRLPSSGSVAPDSVIRQRDPVGSGLLRARSQPREFAQRPHRRTPAERREPLSTKG
jgi:hypothetical protein